MKMEKKKKKGIRLTIFFQQNVEICGMYKKIILLQIAYMLMQPMFKHLLIFWDMYNTISQENGWKINTN